MSEPDYLDAGAGNPVVLTGSSAFIVEIGVLKQRLAERDAQIVELKKEVAHWTDLASQADIFVHRYGRVIEALRVSTSREELAKALEGIPREVLAEAGIV